MRRRVNRPRFLVGCSLGLLLVFSVLQWWSPSWYGVMLGSLLLGSLFLIGFFALMSLLFDSCWPTRVDSRSHR
jgi:uncharacterized protein (DUF2062 family)